MATAWISVIGSAVTAVAALGGVMLAQRATRARDLDGRIWECRSWAYEDLMHWILATSRAVDVSVPGGEADGRAPGLSGDQARALLPAPDLEARVTAYASTDILRGFRHCQRLLTSPPRQGGAASDVAWAARTLGDDIRDELRTGRELQEPLTFRLQDKWENLRGTLARDAGRRPRPPADRLLEQGDDDGFTW
jgi:hypothetical protein